MLILVPHVVDALTAVEGAADLLIGLNEAFELNVQVTVLILQNGAMSVQSIDFGPNIVVALAQALIAEPQIVDFVSGDGE